MNCVALVDIVSGNRLILDEFYFRHLLLLLRVVDADNASKIFNQALELWRKAYVGPMTRLIFAFVNCIKAVASSVLKTQLNTGSPSSEALQLKAYATSGRGKKYAVKRYIPPSRREGYS